MNKKYNKIIKVSETEEDEIICKKAIEAMTKIPQGK